MKILKVLFCLIISVNVWSQSENRRLYDDLLVSINNRSYDLNEVYSVFQKIKIQYHKKNASADDTTLYTKMLWFYPMLMAEMIREEGQKGNWEKALQLGLEGIAAQEEGLKYYPVQEYIVNKSWIYQGLILCYSNLGKLDGVQTCRDSLYVAYKENRLAEEINKSFYFDFFKWKEYNIWGHEYYKDLAKDEDHNVKFRYYVYTTNSDGSNKDILYSVNLVQFPFEYDTDSGDLKVEYVFIKNPVAGTSAPQERLWSYDEGIDYKILMADIRKIIKGDYEIQLPHVITDETTK